MRHVASTGEIRAAVPASALRTVATWGAVERIEPAAQAMTARYGGRTLSKEERGGDRHRAAATTSEGVRAHAADTARETTKVTGVGHEAVRPERRRRLARRLAGGGELPAVDVLPNMAGDGDEGTAMLEILHDMAPGAELGFATAFISDASLRRQHPRAARRRLRRDRRRHPVLQRVAVRGRADRPGGQRRHRRRRAVLQLGRQRGQHARRHVRQLRGRVPRLRPHRRQVRGGGARLRSRHRGAGVRADLARLRRRRARDAVLGEPRSARPPTTTTCTCSTAPARWSTSPRTRRTATTTRTRSCSRRPLGGSGLRLAVVRFTGEPRYFQLSALRGRFEAAGGLPAWVTPGVTRGHSAAQEAFSIAAAPAAAPLPFSLEPGDPPNPSGPFPGSFTAAQLPERFTSDGPRRVFFPAEQVRQKPDFTAADGVNTSVAGLQAVLRDLAPPRRTRPRSPR